MNRLVLKNVLYKFKLAINPEVGLKLASIKQVEKV